MSTALVDVSKSLQKVLLAAIQSDSLLSPLFVTTGSSVVSLLTPDGMVEADQTGISIWLYRLSRDEHTLNRPPRRFPPDRLEPPQLPLRLHYLIIPMMRGSLGEPAPETDQHVLGAILQTFHRRSILTGALLDESLLGTDRQITIRLESPDLEELARVWDTLDEPYRACACYEVRLAEVENDQSHAYGPPVMQSEPDLGKAAPFVKTVGGGP